MNKRPRIIAFTGDVGYYRLLADGAFAAHLRELGDLTLVTGDTSGLAALFREHDIFVSHHATPFETVVNPLMPELVKNPGRLKFVVCTHGGIGPRIGSLLDAGIAITNWGDAPGIPIATRSLALLMALLHDLPSQIDAVRSGAWSLLKVTAPHVYGGVCDGLRVGVYGLGAAGRAFVRMALPLGMELSGYDPYATPWPEGVRRVESLGELCKGIHALVVLAALVEDTCGSVTAAHFAALPDGGIVINAARGGILDQDALFAELLRGRLRGGLDVLGYGMKSEPDYLPPEHPVRQLPNCILTCHVGAANRLNEPALNRNEIYCLENIQRFVKGEPLRWAIDREKLKRMT